MTKQDDVVVRAAEPLKGTPYELSYVSAPTPTDVRYVFQHVTVYSPEAAAGVVAKAKLDLAAGRADRTDRRATSRRRHGSW